MLPEGRRSAIERATMWTHQLVPQSEYERRVDDGGASSEWQGRLAAIKSMIKSQLVAHQKANQKASDAKIAELDAKIDANQRAMGAKIGDLDAKIDANQKAMGAKMSELLDAIKVLSPPPIPGQAEEKTQVDEEQVEVDVSAGESQFPLASAAALSLSCRFPES